MADLSRYQAKRHAGKTPEPLDSPRGGHGAAPIFVVQRHAARRLHFDFRLERAGALASWALPRGVPLRAGERALAVHVEDHPLSYAGFEGEIPSGEYGAGDVEVWDHGTYEVVTERPGGRLTVLLHGTRLEGEWALIPAHLDGDEKNWLIVRASKEGALGPARAYAPMRPRAASRVPGGAGWAFEISWDGARALAPVEGARARLVHDEGEALDTRAKGLLSRLPRAVRTSDCVLDGVLCALDDDGQPRSSLLQQGGTLLYVAVDLLELEGVPLIDETWESRRARLDELVVPDADELRVSRAYDDGRELRAAARARGLGILAKRRGSRYRVGAESDDWRRFSG
jgi:bifunctional non-homologous end joining protein LigD